MIFFFYIRHNIRFVEGRYGVVVPTPNFLVPVKISFKIIIDLKWGTYSKHLPKRISLYYQEFSPFFHVKCP